MKRIHVTVRARPLSAEEAKTSPWLISGNSISNPNSSSKFEFVSSKTAYNVHGLRILNLKNCKNLQCIPELPLLLECLDADGCSTIEFVPDGIFLLNGLETLKLRGCSKLKTLPLSSVEICSVLKNLYLSC